MSVLFVSGDTGPDYQCDVVMHGLRTILGADLVDVNRATHMYSADNPPEVKAKLYGRGFTLFGLLPDDSVVDRSDSDAKIRTRFFDAVVYGSIHRCQDYLSTVLQYYPSDRIAFIDGEDENQLLNMLLGRGRYFKRELWWPEPLTLPISFGIPEEKIFRGPYEPKNCTAQIDPANPSTYIYETEEAYYQGYRDAMFAWTMPKGGWDCMRHYEIISQGCIPLFRLIERCPVPVMAWLPKWELWRARDTFGAGPRDFECLREQPWIHQLRGQLMWELPTTKSVARGVLHALRPKR